MAEVEQCQTMPVTTGNNNPSCPIARYCEDVRSGKIVASKWVRFAVERHLLDRENGKNRGLWWDQDAADHAIAFFRLLRHSKGRWNDGAFELSPWQAFIVGMIFGWKRADGTRRFRRAFVDVARKNGKALYVGTPIATPTGWKTMGDIEPGDYVFAVDGKPTRVVGVSDVMHGRECFRVEFSDGESIVADAEHLWETDARTDRFVTRGEPNPTVKTTRQILETLTHGTRPENNHRVRLAEPLDLPDADLPIDPYTLGVWLGDGTSENANLTCSSDDGELIENLRSAGTVVTFKAAYTGSKACKYLMGSVGHATKRADCLQTKLRAARLLGNKHIPAAYLRASRSQRMALLQGLMDTDGSASKAGQCEFSSCSAKLRDGVMELARSLGFKPTLKTAWAKCNGKYCGAVYRIQFWAYSDDSCFRLSRKSARLKHRPERMTRAGYRVITNVVPVESRPVKCIAVEHPERLYLAGAGMIPTHNTTLAAAIGLYLLMCDGEAGAEIYAAATKRDQAKLVFEDAKALIAKSPELAEHVERYRYSITIHETRSKFEPLGADSDTLDGLNPFVAICDEIHAWKSRDLWDVLETGMGAREQPLMFAITTAGSFEDSIYNTLRVSAESMLEAVGHRGGMKDDGTFAFIACLDPEDDWLDHTKYEKANPNLGVSVQLDELKETVKRAKNQPASINVTKRNRLGIRTNALNAWLRLDLWDKSGEPYDYDSLGGLPCWGGLDLSSTQDLAAFVLVFPIGGTTEKPIYRTRVWCWCPNEADDKSAEEMRIRLHPWEETGHIEFTNGSSVDIATIEATIKAAKTKYDIRSICFDPWQCESTAQRLAEDGLAMVKFPQNCATYNEPARAFERAVIDGRFQHGGNPLLRWMAGNCVIAENGAGFIMPSKRKSRDKVDAIVAAVMAVGCHLKVGDVDESSIYEKMGFDS